MRAIQDDLPHNGPILPGLVFRLPEPHAETRAFDLNEAQMTAVGVMRALLLLTEVDREAFTRSFDSFDQRTMDPT